MTTDQQPQDPIPTTERLAQALEAAGDPALKPMIKRARRGYYDDYKSPLAAPIVQLVADLRAAGHPAPAERAMDGEFDATPEEAEAWAKSPEGLAVFRELRTTPQGEAIYQALFSDPPKKRKRGRQ